MRTYQTRAGVFVLTVILLLSMVTPGAASADGEPNLTMKAANRGSQVTIHVSGSGLEDLYAYQFNLEYDSKLVKFVRAASPISGFMVDPIDKDGYILFAHSKVGKVSGTDGDAALAALTFERLSGGEAEFKLHGIKFVDSKLEMAELGAKVELTTSLVRFVDIEGHWAGKSIVEGSGQGWVTGYEDGTFRPQRQVTRAEFIAMLVRALALPIPSAPQLAFADRESIPAWARGYAASAAEANLIEGYEDGTFRADKLVSRDEMATLIVRSQGIVPESGNGLSFADTDEIPLWAQPYVAAAVGHGWVKGIGNNLFAPSKPATRAEAVHLILKIHRNSIQ